MTGRRVLIDGLYSSEREGTGVSQYARTLQAGLSALGHSVTWLSGAGAQAKPDALADRVSLADAPAAPRSLLQKLETARRMADGLLEGEVTVRHVPGNAATGGAQDAYLAPNLYVNAHYRHALLRQFVDVRKPDGIDVLHLTAPLPIRMRGVRTVTTIHDLVPIRLPATTPDNKPEFIARVRSCARLSDLIITVSEASKRDIVDLLDVDPAKVAVTYQPTDLAPLGPDEHGGAGAALARMGLEPGGYALFVGALEPKKNIRRLIEAYLDVDAPHPLVIVGRKAWLWEEDFAALNQSLGEKAKQRLRFMGYAPREDLRALYAGAMMFLFPSLYEGFGLPALEAMRMGCPTIVSRVASLPEVCGEAALYVDPMDRADIRARIEQLMSDAALRARLAAAGPAQAERFSFDAYVKRLGDAYGGLEA